MCVCAGGVLQCNFATMYMCLMWSDNAYFIPNYSATGFTCRTNTPSNTACRGPGAIKSIWLMENVMERVAFELKCSPDYVRTQNFYVDGQLTPYQQPIVNSTMVRCFQAVQAQANYTQVQAAVAQFNAANRWRKRGVHIAAIKYGIADPGNQAAILLNVMQDDGTITFAHSGIEIGQGIHTKVAQAIAYGLGVDVSLIQYVGNDTRMIPNATQTGGSATSECTCAAAMLACTDLNTRLAPIKTANPGKTWPQIIALAAAAGVNLSVTGLYAPPAPALPFTYYVWGAACAQVEIDVLTGELQILQVDIVYDNGNSLNPTIDIGQIEGGFMMGLGHSILEEVLYDPQTALLTTDGTWFYTPPFSQDIPINFNVSLLPGAPNALGILSSKATGEPPLMLANSVFFAIKDAIFAARRYDAQRTVPILLGHLLVCHFLWLILHPFLPYSASSFSALIVSILCVRMVLCSVRGWCAVWFQFSDAGVTSYFELAAPATPANIQQLCQVTAQTLVL